METLFSYNTRISFGLGATHFSVTKTKNGKYFYQHGTPQQPGPKHWVNLSPEQEKVLRSCKQNSPQNYEYIYFKLLGNG